MDWPICKLQVCKFVLIEFAPPEWQNVFHVKCQKLDRATIAKINIISKMTVKFLHCKQSVNLERATK